MALMAIDHASYFVANRHVGEFWGLALPTFSPGSEGDAWFLTRLLTHLCAPGFFLLMGASLSLFADTRREAGWSDGRIRRYWISRGALLVLLQHLVENPAWLLGTIDEPVTSQPPGGGGEVLLHFGVLYGLGVAMIVGALLLRAPTFVLAVLAPSAILLTAAIVTGVEAARWLTSPLWLLVAIPGHAGPWQVLYPALPWAGVGVLGVLLGRALRGDPTRAFRFAPLVGMAMLAGFLVVRTLDGSAGQWLNIVLPQSDGLRALLSVVKYPPAPAFLLLTLGTNLVLLGVLAARKAPPGRSSPLVVFGQSALCFYLLHLYVYAAMGAALPGPHGLAAMYASWLAGLILLYPACRWFRDFKSKQSPESLWRLL